ncbi:hypothetical protein [Sphingobacterium haloxyli]|uniref:Uncharacterized protein n=1 Tax=Sphingobacterium haloxyli TaxID=2100533 RepID=A0A2S9IVM3_9SPHI|nr:hypothetical protein [Sphingobacterium haloxyli]PRD44581.1 hypothetical protein C5745_19040 [Sphingobacterium haloxyli]
MTDFVKGCISIGADVTIIREVLVQHRYIKEWEKGFDSFKELHVSEGMTTILHWDIEHGVDYIFNVKENKGDVLLELVVEGVSTVIGGKYNLEEVRYYVDTVLSRIKALSQKLKLKNKE